MKKLIFLFTFHFILLHPTIPQSKFPIKAFADSSVISDNKTKNSENDDKTFLEKNSKDILIIVLGLVMSIISSIVTVKLSIDKFRAENWWQLKNQTYSKIIEALHHMKIFYSEMIDDESEESSLSDNLRKGLNKKWKSGYEILSMETDKGSFIVSKKASLILKNSMKELKKNFENPNWSEYIDVGYGIIDDCLNKLRDEAKSDLKVK